MIANSDRSSPHVAPRRADLPAEAVYRRRRLILGGLLVGLLAASGAAAHDVLAGSGGVPASAAGAAPARARPSIVAHPGQTLWAISDQFHGDIDFDRYLDTLVNLNGGPSIQAGQRITLP